MDLKNVSMVTTPNYAIHGRNSRAEPMTIGRGSLILDIRHHEGSGGQVQIPYLEMMIDP